MWGYKMAQRSQVREFDSGDTYGGETDLTPEQLLKVSTTHKCTYTHTHAHTTTYTHTKTHKMNLYIHDIQDVYTHTHI